MATKKSQEVEPLKDLSEISVTVVDSKAAQMQIMDRIFQAESIDELLNLHASGVGTEMVDKPIVIVDAEFRDAADQYKKQGSLPIYSVIHYYDDGAFNLDTGEAAGKPKVFTCGGANVVGQLGVVQQKRLFPFRCKLIQKETSNGFNVFWLANA